MTCNHGVKSFTSIDIAFATLYLHIKLIFITVDHSRDDRLKHDFGPSEEVCIARLRV